MKNKSIVVNGKTYKLKKKIGHGDHGVIFLAHGDIGDVAIKKMKIKENAHPSKTWKDPDHGNVFFVSTKFGDYGEIIESGKDSVLREINYGKKLEKECPSFLQIFDYEIKPGTEEDVEDVYIIMEYFKGYTMAQYHKCQRETSFVLPLEDFLKFMKCLLEGLECMHSNGLVHRDLHKGNIMFNNNEVKIIDYGQICYPKEEGDCPHSEREYEFKGRKFEGDFRKVGETLVPLFLGGITPKLENFEEMALKRYPGDNRVIDIVKILKNTIFYDKYPELYFDEDYKNIPQQLLAKKALKDISKILENKRGKKSSKKRYSVIETEDITQNQMKSYFPNLQPTDQLKDQIFLTSLKKLGLSKKIRSSYKKSLHSQPFIFGHVSGTGEGSPKRGVLVMGNSTFEENPIVMEKTNWTASQNNSNITLVSKTVPYPKQVSAIIPKITDYSHESFPDAPISPATYALAVGNLYRVGDKHTISGHTDAQPWYASPPVFASITTFPKGEPEDWRATYRFQVYDPGHSKYIDLYLADESVCVMRADIMHRVLPPLGTVSNHKPRVNITLRNLVSPYTDPLGYTLAMANHYRYYGLPLRMLIPKDVSKPETLIERYQELNPDIEIIQLKKTRNERNEKKKKLRLKMVDLYEELGEDLNIKMMGKSNVVLESLVEALNI